MALPIAPLAPIAGLPPLTPLRPTADAAPGFGDALVRGLQQVSGLEQRADGLIADVASGGPTKVHEVMVATTESALAVDLLVQVRDRALEAYHEIMRLQL
jgi:flagellar hook-basal body complex protein FliE